MSQVTTHVIDTSKGKPADGITVFLYQRHSEEWKEIAIGTTDRNGRIPNLLNKEALLEAGAYKIRFETESYHEKHAVLPFYPFVEIIFYIRNTEHYHVPLLLNPFGYSTYRGS